MCSKKSLLCGCQSQEWKLSAASDNCVQSNVSIFCMLRLPYGVLHFHFEGRTMHIIVFYFKSLPTVQCVEWNVGVSPNVCVPTRASHTAAVTDKADPFHRRKTCSLLPLDSQTTVPVLSPGTNVQLLNANSVRSYRHYFPSEKCRMDGDFLLYDFTGVVTVQCEIDTLSQFDKWGIIMKMAFWKLR